MKGLIRRHRFLTFLAVALALVFALSAWFVLVVLQRLPDRDTAFASPAHGPAIGASRALIAAMRGDALYPSMSVAIAIDGKVLWREAVGWRDVGSKEPAKVTTQYAIGSVSKSLTATAAIVLVDQGVLALDAPISTYLPQLPAPYRKVTMRPTRRASVITRPRFSRPFLMKAD